MSIEIKNDRFQPLAVRLNQPFKINPDLKEALAPLNGGVVVKPLEIHIESLGRGWIHILKGSSKLDLKLEIEKVKEGVIPFIGCEIRHDTKVFRGIKRWDNEEIRQKKAASISFENWYQVGGHRTVNADFFVFHPRFFETFEITIQMKFK